MSDLTVLPDLDAGAAFPTRTMPKVLCCLCGVDIDPNPANMCVNCLRNQVDITEGIPKQIVLHHCRGCDRYLRPPWCAVELESRELLAICLKKITGLNRVRLVDAGFIWTEPHSRRIKVKLVIQKEVLNGVRLQQVFAIEFVMQNQQCDACQRSYTDHTWRAMVQVRQRVEHKRTFFLLEQLILKHRAHEKCINVEQVPAGVDFSFGERSHALKFIDFLSAVVPIRTKAAKQLISEDVQSAIKNYKFSYAAEIVPLCRDDLVVLPAKTAATMGAMNPLCLVQRVSNHIFFLDPRTLQMGEMPAERYWAEPFRPLMGTDRLEEFTVLDVRAVTIAPLTGAALRRKQKGRAPASAPGSRAGGSSVAGSSRRGGMTAVGSTATGSGMDGDGDSDSDGADSDGAAAGGAAAGAGASAGPARTASGSSAASVGSKRRRDGAGGGGADVDDRASTLGASSLAGGSTFAGGFTGAVSLAGGSIQFHGASSVASTVTGGPKGKMLLAEAEIIRTRDLEAGRTDTMTVRTHLGNVLQAGDLVLAFDLTNAVYNEADAEASSLGGRSKARGTARASSKFELPDAVIVRKTYRRKGVGRSGPGGSGAGAAFEDDGASTVISSVLSGKEKRKAARAAAAAGTSSSGAAAGGAGMDADGADESAGAGAGALKPARAARAAAGGAGGGGSGAAKQRLWKLRRFDDELPTTHSDATRKGDEERREAEFEAFLREIEDDPALRKSLNLYKDRAALEAAGLAGALAGAGAGGKGAIGAATRGATAAAPSKVKLRPTSAAAGAGGAAAAGPKLSAAERLAAAARLAAGDDDGDDDEGGEGPPDIDLAELLDEMSLGSSTAAAGAADDAAAKAAAPAAAASSSSAGGAGAAGSAPASAAAGAAEADADAAGAYVDPEDAKLLAQYKAREARMKRLAGSAGGAAGGDDEDDGGDDGGLAAAAAARAAAAAKAARKGKAGKRRDTGAFAARGGAAGRGVALVPETVAEEDGEGEDEDDEDEGEEGAAAAAAAPAAAGDKA